MTAFHSVTDEYREAALEMLQAVHIRDPERVYTMYPHQVSGGMGQRVMIAMMLIAGPDILIADEPTSALDVTVQTQVLAIMDDLVRSRGMGLILISHNLHLVLLSHFLTRQVVIIQPGLANRHHARIFRQLTQWRNHIVFRLLCVAGMNTNRRVNRRIIFREFDRTPAALD